MAGQRAGTVSTDEVCFLGCKEDSSVQMELEFIRKCLTFEITFVFS